MPQFRGIFESVRFSRQKQGIGGDPSRLDDLLAAVTWALARDPPVVPGTGLIRIQTSDGVHGLPPLTIYVTVDGADSCTLQWIEESLDPWPDDAFTESDLDDLSGA
jgi:hypothetical protein